MLFWIPLLPLIGFLINSFAGRDCCRKRPVGTIASPRDGRRRLARPSVAVRALVSLPAESREITQTLFTWIGSADFQVPLGLRLDPLSALMILVVTGIGFLIHVYSTAYMVEEEPSEYARYFAYLNLFAAFMLLLVLGDSFIVMFVGWEGVGLCSYLLIGFWYQKTFAADAGKKAFIVNRIGDVAFILGVLLAFSYFGTLNFRAAQRRDCAAADRDGVWRGLRDRAAAVHRGNRQIGADSALRLAARRDGGPDAGIGAYPCGDDGDGGSVFDRAKRGAVRACS